ncbi:MAG: hypothetical protein NTY45_08570, partial [Elusimicrobia bacterium]|nr:hypothetical protein [Elusimicrobiota bacterium]
VSAFFAVYELQGRGREGAAAWLAVGVMLVFGYAKFYWIMADPVSPRVLFPRGIWPLFTEPDLFLPVFAVQTLAFSALCTGILIFFYAADSCFGEPAPEPVPAGRDARLSKALILALPFFAAISLYAVATFKVGVLGLVSAPLPLHLSGVFYYFQTILLPVFILAQVYLSEKSGKIGLARAGIFLLFLWAGADALVRGSRASLVLAPLLTVFMAFCGGVKLRKWELAAIAAAVTVALLLAPLAVQYRLLRVQGLGVMETLFRLLACFSAGWASVFKTAVFFFFRVPGAETLFALLGMSSGPLKASAFGVILSPEGLPGYITKEIFRINYTMAFAPSFVGGAYVLWGYVGIAAFSAAGAGISVFGWKGLRRLPLRLMPVASAFFLLLFFWLVTEGLTPIVVKQVFSAAAACALCEVVLLFAARRDVK